tara:strand:- start:2189 stop:2875 length:687 start_codon:yes stop_codon:yes gene_type:complete
VAKVQAHARSKAFAGVGRLPGTLAAGIEEYSAERVIDWRSKKTNKKKCPLWPKYKDQWHTVPPESLVKKYGDEWFKRQTRRIRRQASNHSSCCLEISKDGKVEADLRRKGELTPMAQCHEKTTCVGLVTMTGDEDAMVCRCEHSQYGSHGSYNAMIQGSGSAEYKFEEGMEKAVKTFRQRGTGGDALLIKIDHEADLLRVDEQFKGKSVEDMGEYLQEQSRPQCARPA